MIQKISKLLNENKIFHKIEDNFIVTRRAKIKIPDFDLNLAYLSGVIVGDGAMVKTIRKRGGKHYVLSIYSNSTKYLEYLNNLFQKYFNYKGHIYKDKRHKVSALMIQTAPIFFYFVELGLPVGKPEKENVPVLIKQDKAYFKEYIAGLCDTDGHVEKYKRIQLKQKSKELLCEIEEFLNGEFIKCSYPKVNYTDGKPYYYIRMEYKLPLRLKVPP